MKRLSKAERAGIAEAWIEDRMVSPAANEAEERLVAHMKQSMAQYDAAAAGLMAELAEQGFALRSVADLERLGQPYRAAIPILLRWLPRIEYQPLRRDVMSALAVRWAKREVLGPLLAEFRAASDAQHRWDAGDAIEQIADDFVYEDVVALATDPSFGRARGPLIEALGRMKHPGAVDAALSQLADEPVAGHALMALRKLKAMRARPHIEPLLTHGTTWIRNEAKKAIAAIDKAATQGAEKATTRRLGGDR